MPVKTKQLPKVPAYAECYGFCRLANGTEIDMEGIRVDDLIKQIGPLSVVDIGESEIGEEAHWYITWGNGKELCIDSPERCNLFIAIQTTL